MASGDTLKDIREKLLGYRLEAVSRMAKIAPERLQQIEAGGEVPTVSEVEALSRLYGIDADRLAEEPIKLAPGDGVRVLTSRAEFRGLDDVTRARVVAAANAARDVVRLRQLAGVGDPRECFRQEAPSLTLRAGVPPFRQGAQAASSLRTHFTMGEGPIESLRDFVTEKFPSLSVLFADLGGAGPAGLSFLDRLRGPTIVLNTAGKNRNPCVRRFSLAHELCHLLVDWNRNEPLALISGYLNESQLLVEQRANAFAVRFICPEKVIRKLATSVLTEPAAGRLLASYGLPYSALRLYMRNEGNRELPEIAPPSIPSLGTEARWVGAEEPAGMLGFPLPEVPSERRTEIARLAARLYSEGKIQRDRFADLLGVTPTADLESVLDFLSLNVPSAPVEDFSASIA